MSSDEESYNLVSLPTPSPSPVSDADDNKLNTSHIISDDETEKIGMFCLYNIYVMVVQVVLYFLLCIKILSYMWCLYMHALLYLFNINTNILAF